jgi:hypothetical protein
MFSRTFQGDPGAVRHAFGLECVTQAVDYQKRIDRHCGHSFIVFSITYGSALLTNR